MKTLLTTLSFIFLFTCFNVINSQVAKSQNCIIEGYNPVIINVTVYYTVNMDNIVWEIVANNGAYIRNVNGRTAEVFCGTVRWTFFTLNIKSHAGVVLCSKSITVEDENVSPVELSSFVSATNSRNVTLNWSTASEENNSGFQIERSGSVNNWIDVGFVNGKGNVSQNTNYEFVDRNISSGRYNYRLKQIDFNGNFEYYDLMNEVIIGNPEKFALHQNYPNPFNPNSKINFDIPNDAHVKISVIDVTGKEIMTALNEFKPAGYYTININGNDLSGGIYFCRLSAGDYVSVVKMVLLK